MIEGLIGRPGSGKSYELTRRVLQAADRDRIVFTNYAVSHPNVFLFEPDQLMDLPPGLVVIDEAHLWFPARMALKLPMSWLGELSQTRKNGWDLLWCAQHENRIDRVIRDVTSWLWLCRAWGSWSGHPIVFSRMGWEPELFRKPKKHFARSYSMFDSRVAEAYNTFERVSQAEHTRNDGDVYENKSKRAAGRRNGSVLS